MHARKKLTYEFWAECHQSWWIRTNFYLQWSEHMKIEFQRCHMYPAPLNNLNQVWITLGNSMTYTSPKFHPYVFREHYRQKVLFIPVLNASRTLNSHRSLVNDWNDTSEMVSVTHDMWQQWLARPPYCCPWMFNKVKGFKVHLYSQGKHFKWSKASVFNQIRTWIHDKAIHKALQWQNSKAVA